MSSVALGVPNDGTDGTTAAHCRKILKGLLGGAGIVAGCAVGGTAAASYRVAEGVVACSRGDSDGVSLAYVEAQSVATTGNASSYARVDAVWVAAHDKTQGDADNHVTVGCTQGEASAAPAAPEVPSGATLLATMRVPAGATTTEYATTVARGGAPGLTLGGTALSVAPLYQLYNEYDKDHYLTFDKGEYDSLVAAGWTGNGTKCAVLMGG